MNLSSFYTLPVVGILRGITAEMVEPIAELAKRSGLKALEITMNTNNVLELIPLMKKASEGKFDVGAGTVLNVDDLQAALAVGASFIVSPNTNKQVIEFCAKKSIPVFPGALTPTEVAQAWEYGATMVKLFPSNVFGPKYIKDLLGPLNSVKLLACGGVSTSNVGEYFQFGASGVAFGSSIFNLELFQTGNYEEVENRLNLLLKSVRDLHLESELSY